MELFDEQVYQNLQEEYEKELGKPESGFKRAMLGAKPFDLKESEEKIQGREHLSYAMEINDALLDKCKSYGGEVARVVRNLLIKNKELFEKLNLDKKQEFWCEDQDFFTKAIEELCSTLENAVSLYPIPEVQVLLSRSYTVYALIILG